MFCGETPAGGFFRLVTGSLPVSEPVGLMTCWRLLESAQIQGFRSNEGQG